MTEKEASIWTRLERSKDTLSKVEQTDEMSEKAEQVRRLNGVFYWQYHRNINEKQWKLLLSILSGSPVFSSPQYRILASPQSKGKILEKLKKYSYQLDLRQEKIAKQIPYGIQRIKGIAGSGKTRVQKVKA